RLLFLHPVSQLLVNGTSMCSGRLEVKTNQSTQRWSSVCEDVFDQQDAEVVCRELGCGAPLVLQGALYGEVEAPMWTKEFQCGGRESALLDCRSSGSDRNTCSPGKDVGLTCSEPVRLVGGNRRCAGTLEVKYQREWRPVDLYFWPRKEAAAACRELDCGSAVSVEERESSYRSVWWIRSNCVQFGSALRESVGLTCSGRRGAAPDAVRLVGGASRCAGTLELQYHRYWRPVGGYYYPGWNLKKADAVCRELNCGSAVSVEERQELTHTCSSRLSPAAMECHKPIPLSMFSLSVWVFFVLCVPECTLFRLPGNDCKAGNPRSPEPALTFQFESLNCCFLASFYSVWCLFSFSIVSSIISPDSVRLMNGTSLCSGRLEVKTNQSTQRWSSVCEDDFDQQDAEVVCRELGCGPPSVLQGVGAAALIWLISVLMKLTLFFHAGFCSEPVRLVGGSSHCAGILEVKQGEWRPMVVYPWTLMTAAAACRELDCGSAVSVEERKESSHRSVWRMRSNCVHPLGQPVTSLTGLLQLVNGTSLCSGRLEVKTNQSTQRWSSVCEDDFDQQDAEVVCRELGCGPPSILQGVLYGEVEPPMRSKEFQCGGHESALMDCRSSGSDRNTCSPGKVVGLTCSGRRGAAALIWFISVLMKLTLLFHAGFCSEPVRLVGGSSHCAGTLEVKQGEWRPMVVYPWTLKTAAAVCRELDCGSAVSVEERKESSHRSVWRMRSNCVQSGSALRDCAESRYSAYIQDLTCSGKSITCCSLLDSVRLVNGTSLCSGRLEVKTNQSTQHWSSVCEDDFDQQDAEVVCRELGCGAPSVLQGALYGEVEPPMWTKEFQCGGNESALLDCRSSVSDRNTCSPGKAVGVTCSGRRGAAALIWFISVLMKLTLFFHAGFCSEPVRLVGGAIHCAGTLEVKQGEWRPMVVYPWTLKTAAAVCRELDCGSAVSVEERKESSDRSVWRMRSNCVQSGSALRECAESHYSAYIQDFTCSGKPISESSMTSCMTVMYPC
uniref:SRCR domain-containing protein n=1 Tax=Sander lucioperca TaxID=283035 RepID=A0A8D0DB66_SANLU